MALSSVHLSSYSSGGWESTRVKARCQQGAPGGGSGGRWLLQLPEQRSLCSWAPGTFLHLQSSQCRMLLPRWQGLLLPLPSSSYQDAFDFLESLFTAHHNERVSTSKVEKQSFANISQKPLHLSYLSQPLPVRRSNHSPALTLIVTLPLCFTTVLSLSAYPFICFFLMEFELSFNKKKTLFRFTFIQLTCWRLDFADCIFQVRLIMLLCPLHFGQTGIWIRRLRHRFNPCGTHGRRAAHREARWIRSSLVLWWRRLLMLVTH